MRYDSVDAEMRRVMRLADEMMAAARTAPKAKGIDKLHCFALDGEDKDALASYMKEYGEKNGRESFIRDGLNVEKAQAIVFFGTTSEAYGLDCRFCGAENCREAVESGINCFFAAHDLGLAVGSAVSMAAGGRADNRVMFSAGFCAMKAGLFRAPVKAAMGVPLSISGKSIFFDRK